MNDFQKDAVKWLAKCIIDILETEDGLNKLRNAVIDLGLPVEEYDSVVIDFNNELLPDIENLYSEYLTLIDSKND